MIAILGATGQLGTAFVRLLGKSAAPITRDELDLSDTPSIATWANDTRPELMINCAGYTDVDAAEMNEGASHLVNTLAVGALARAASDIGSRFVTFSTDYVFDGNKTTGYIESDAPNPMSVYGRTKLEGEQLARSVNPESLVIRTSWVLSGTHPNFAATMLRLIRKGQVRVVNDQRGRPTVVDDLAKSTLTCLDSGASGVLHLTNQGETTWFGLAQEVAELAGLDRARVKPCSTADFPRPAARPANSVLDSERFADLAIPPTPHYRESLDAVVQSLVERGY